MNVLDVLDVGELTDIGLQREKNEDLPKIHIPTDQTECEAGALFIVADGMGGLGGGDVASQYTVDETLRHYYSDTGTDLIVRLHNALQSASHRVSEEAPRIGLPRIGSTAAGVVLTPAGNALVFNI